MLAANYVLAGYDWSRVRIILGKSCPVTAIGDHAHTPNTVGIKVIHECHVLICMETFCNIVLCIAIENLVVFIALQCRKPAIMSTPTYPRIQYQSNPQVSWFIFTWKVIAQIVLFLLY
jgi:hypothetical protein